MSKDAFEAFSLDLRLSSSRFAIRSTSIEFLCCSPAIVGTYITREFTDNGRSLHVLSKNVTNLIKSRLRPSGGFPFTISFSQLFAAENANSNQLNRTGSDQCRSGATMRTQKNFRNSLMGPR